MGPLMHRYLSIVNTIETDLQLVESMDSELWIQKNCITWKADYRLHLNFRPRGGLVPLTSQIVQGPTVVMFYF